MSINQHGMVPAETPARPDEDAITPLDVMLATMRWAHEEAERLCAARSAPTKDAADTSKTIASLRTLALSGAKDAAPYVHMRLATSTPRDPASKSHEEWLAELERTAPVRTGH